MGVMDLNWDAIKPLQTDKPGECISLPHSATVL